MKSKLNLIIAGTLLLLATTSFAADYKKNDPALTIPECKTIEDACANVGFIRGQWKIQNGLWKDCVSPIAKGHDTLFSKANLNLKATPDLILAAKTCMEKKPKNSTVAKNGK
jgi:hypothetical protein